MLKVIGLGYPRTGTMSLKFALEALKLGPCYHMIEVFDRPQDCRFWLQALQQHDSDWDTIFRDFQSTTDAPACYFWKSLVAHYSDARLILTVRDSESWYQSFQSTVYQAMTHPERAPDDAHRQVQHMAHRLILETMFEGRFEDKDFAIHRYEEHNRQVARDLPAHQLLTFNVAEGWDPLCHFLNCPVPDMPFPCSNSRAEFQNRFNAH